VVAQRVQGCPLAEQHEGARVRRAMNELNGNWYALFVRSRHEFVTTEQLRKLGVEAFLPSIGKTRRWSDREKRIQFPLFPGYVFVKVRPSAEIFLRILKVPGSVSFVTQDPGRPVQVDPQEMQSLRMMLETGENIDVFPHLFEGARVTVNRGPLNGAEGILMQKNENHIFLVNINILGRSVGMRINAEDLEQH